MNPTQLLILVLLLVTLVSCSKVAEDQPSPFQVSSSRLLSNKSDTRSDDNPSPSYESTISSTKAASEERAVSSSVFSKFKGLFRENFGLSNKLGSARKNTDLVATVEKMPIVKKLGTAVEKNPTFFKQLSKDPEAMKRFANNPEVVKVSAMLEKSNVKVKVTKEKMSQLRSAAGKDPAKIGVLDVIDGLAHLGLMATIGALMIFLVGFAGWGLFTAFEKM